MVRKIIFKSILCILQLILSIKKNKKGLFSISGSAITLTNNEIKYKIKIIKSLENKGVFLGGTSDKSVNKKGGLLNFLVH